MRQLKNWVVIFESVKRQKGLMTYLQYLTSHEHPNHRKVGHKVINIKSWKKVFANVSNVIQKHQTQQVMKSKGGRPISKFGTSVTLNLPLNLSEEVSKKIMNRLLWKYVTGLNELNDLKMNREEIKTYVNELVYYNIHMQPKGSKTQFNFVFCEYINGVKLDLSKKKYSHLFKMVSNELLRDEFNIDHAYYQIEQSKKSKRRKKIKQYKSEKLDALLEETQRKQEYEVLRLKDAFSTYLDDLDSKVQKRLETYFKRIKNAEKENDRDKFDKYVGLVDKTLTKASESLHASNATKGFEVPDI